MLFPSTDLLLPIDQLPYVTARAVTAARIEAQVGGLAGESSFVFCAQAAEAREVCVSVGSVPTCSFVHPSGNGRLYGINNQYIFSLL